MNTSLKMELNKKILHLFFRQEGTTKPVRGGHTKACFGICRPPIEKLYHG